MVCPSQQDNRKCTQKLTEVLLLMPPRLTPVVRYYAVFYIYNVMYLPLPTLFKRRTTPLTLRIRIHILIRMPNKTIYIRQEDEPLFSEKYTPQWLHRKLHEGKYNSKEERAWQTQEDIGNKTLWQTTNEKETTKPAVPAVSVNPGNVQATAKSLSAEKGYDFCKHNQVRGFCKQGCK